MASARQKKGKSILRKSKNELQGAVDLIEFERRQS